MYLGRIVELAPDQELYKNPLHPYTKALLSAVPIPDPLANTEESIILSGDVPSPVNPPKGCTFHPRCPMAMDKCQTQPLYRQIQPDHWIACHLYP
jgi:oligopeptide/dipeptide ABC transporter ATP-binding protein